ncbi:MAG: hypothetical protein JRI87_03230 [Deltaproteobacteria bacterium]|nr:hypothetical protein [Deltaproteobacteria bacterium]
MHREKIKLSVEIPDKNYWKRLVSCQEACPVHTDARGYVRAIAERHAAVRLSMPPSPSAHLSALPLRNGGQSQEVRHRSPL